MVLLGFGSCWCGGIIDDVRTCLGAGVDRVAGGLRFWRGNMWVCFCNGERSGASKCRRRPMLMGNG